ncbi:MAG TPA: cytochrome c oxidase subunit 3 [Anaeromyxobacteraceae bacterium]|nr:cytochrome c oxidase subunit 3 [Anaeromyxobacteraceae bacterium]
MARQPWGERRPSPGAVLDLATHRRASSAEVTAWLGMVVFLGSWAMMFAGLFFAYGLVRARAAVWPPLDQPPLPLLLPGLNSAVIAGSSAALLGALRALGGRRRRAGAWLVVLAAGLGALFLALQAVVWARLWQAGLVPSGGPYPSAFYALTALHALHVLVGVAALARLAFRARGGRKAPLLSLRLWGMYWHFVGVVWLLMYLAVYVV